MDALGITYNKNWVLKSAFKQHICSVCGMCKDAKLDPDFCMFLYNHNRDRFFDVIKYFHIEKPQLTFLKFYGIICCSKDVCPVREARCANFEIAIECYKAFIEQNNKKLTRESESKLYGEFSGVEIEVFGKKFALPSDIKQIGKKKTRKRLKSSLKSARKSINNIVNLTNLSVPPHTEGKRKKVKNSVVKNKKVKKKPTTTLIFNSDPEWEEQIKRYLEA